MDSWKYLSEEKGMWLSGELDSSVDGHGRCKNTVMGGEIKPLFNVENYPLVSNTQALERLDLMDLGLSDEIRKSYSISSEPSGEVYSDEIGTDSYGNVVSPFCEERESVSRISTDLMQTNNQDFSGFDLKLGRFADGEGAKEGEFSKASVHASSTLSSLPAKRARSTTLYPQPPYCQVFGCNKDLSSFKGYYKRHKVCDAHTKTVKVIVDGIEQRFCQQCSRFHLLAEFDDGKRSCRRRLAAHNKRRRKPQLASESGARILGFSSSFGFPEMLSSVISDPGQGMDGVPAGARNIDVGVATHNHEKLPGIQQSSRALSLLSAQSHTMSSQLLGAAITNPLINKSSHADSSQHSAGNFKKVAHSGFHAPGMYTMEIDHVEPSTCNPQVADTVDLKLSGYGTSRGPYVRNNTNYHHPKGRGIILDLLQLSSHLQRIEHQRHSTESEAG